MLKLSPLHSDFLLLLSTVALAGPKTNSSNQQTNQLILRCKGLLTRMALRGLMAASIANAQNRPRITLVRTSEQHANPKASKYTPRRSASK
jgi:hypothetical protein